MWNKSITNIKHYLLRIEAIPVSASQQLSWLVLLGYGLNNAVIGETQE
jgi:hypothetical protein